MTHNGMVQAWCIRGESGQIVSAHRADEVQPGASMGKVLVLIEAARGITAGQYHAGELLDRPCTVGDSGLWQHCDVEHFTIADCCRLVGAVSDNMATNALIEFIGLDSVMATTRRDLAPLETLEILDIVRDVRQAAHPPELSVGSTADWSLLMHKLGMGEVISPDVSQMVRTWLSLGVDHSLVLAALYRDPLLSDVDDHFNKTGSDTHVRADAGCVSRPHARFSYAACVSPVVNDEDAVTSLRRLGEELMSM
jgi:beta-lactamase class A